MKYDFKIIQAKLILELVPSEELPDIALEAMTQGFLNESFARIASAKNPELAHEGELLKKSFQEIGLSDITKEEAAKYITKTICLDIVSRIILPYEGAQQISTIYSQLDQQPESLFPFYVSSAEYESYVDLKNYYKNDSKWGSDYYPNLMKKVSEEIIDEAKKFLENN